MVDDTSSLWFSEQNLCSPTVSLALIYQHLIFFFFSKSPWVFSATLPPQDTNDHGVPGIPPTGLSHEFPLPFKLYTRAEARRSAKRNSYPITALLSSLLLKPGIPVGLVLLKSFSSKTSCCFPNKVDHNFGNKSKYVHLYLVCFS